jgi:hypothetical protein
VNDGPESHGEVRKNVHPRKDFEHRKVSDRAQGVMEQLQGSRGLPRSLDLNLLSLVADDLAERFEP